MTAIDFSRTLFPVVLVGFFVVGIVLPTLRVRKRTGAWAVTVFSRESRAERLMGIVLATLMIALAAWIIAYSAWGPGRLGVWDAGSWLIWAGWLVVLDGFALVVIAQVQMGASWRIGIDDQPTDLVSQGLFKLVRNPIYSGIIAMMLGVVLIGPAVWSIALFAAVFAAIRVQTLREEAHMIDMHGEAYLAWASRVGRFFPGVGLLHSEKPQGG